MAQTKLTPELFASKLTSKLTATMEQYISPIIYAALRRTPIATPAYAVVAASAHTLVIDGAAFLVTGLRSVGSAVMDRYDRLCAMGFQHLARICDLWAGLIAAAVIGDSDQAQRSVRILRRIDFRAVNLGRDLWVAAKHFRVAWAQMARIAPAQAVVPVPVLDRPVIELRVVYEDYYAA